MIPALLEKPVDEALYSEFLAALTATGFTGDHTASRADRTVLATDNSVYQIAPQAILFPRTIEDLKLTMRLAAEERFASLVFTPRGGGTGTNGQSLTPGLMIDLSKYMTQILEINVEERWARVQAGVVKDQLNKALEPHGLFFTPELSTSNRATIGGMVSTDASGQGSVIYGKTRNHVLELTSVLLGGDDWTSHPIDDAELARLRSRTDRIGDIHRVVDDIQKRHAPEIEHLFPKLNRCLTGYDLAHIRDEDGRFNLNSVLCGSEGTLAVIAEARLNVTVIPKAGALVIIAYDTFDATLRDAHALLSRQPASIEAIDARVLELARRDALWPTVQPLLPLGSDRPTLGINIVEFVGAADDDVDRQLGLLVTDLETTAKAGRQRHTVVRGKSVARVWTLRKRAAGMLGNMPGEKRPIPFVEDTAVPPENLADYILEFRALLDSCGLQYGMFGHADAGVLHVRPAIDMKDPAQTPLIRRITDEIVHLTQKHGGVLWGEHGKGVRSEYSPGYFGTLYPQVQAVKAAFDAGNQLNPGKVATPGRDGREALLKIDGVPTRGESERAVPAAARASFAEAVFCNGNGACFNFDPDEAMCPSWKGTRERRHSPKGRATLTREWLRRLAASGVDPAAEVAALRAASWWRTWLTRRRCSRDAHAGDDFSHEVKEAMDGCLACKSCVTGCPLKVDVPTFRAKFLELYHGRYGRPMKDYLVGSLEHLLPLSARAPGLYNAVAGSRAGRAIFERLGMADLPRLSRIRFKRELAARHVPFADPARLSALSTQDKRRAVVLVQDAFTRFYETPLVLDIVDLLRALGFTPYIADYRPNGKALHVHGFLAPFRRVATRNAAHLSQLSAAGVPLVGVDPSTTLTFRAEYKDAMLDGPVPEVSLLQEWLVQQDFADHPPGTTGTRANRQFRLLPHCTERALAAAGVDDWKRLFGRLGLSLEVLAGGCCGMAGTYGHEVRHKAMSERIYDLSWRRHVQDEGAAPLLATGYSCRSQVDRFAHVRLQHPAQAILNALRSQD